MVEIEIKSGAATKQRDDAVVLPLLEKRKLTESGQHLVNATGAMIPGYLRRFDHLGKFGDVGIYYPAEMAGLFTKRIVFIGTGEEKGLTLEKLRRLSAIVARKLNQSGARHISLYLPELNVRGASLSDKVQAVSEGIWFGLYRFDKYKSKVVEDADTKRELRSVTLMIPNRNELTLAAEAVVRAKAVAIGVQTARDLANEPGNVCTPAWLGEQALTLASEKTSVEVLDRAALEAQNFPAIVAVGKGSVNEPRLIVLRYRGANDDAPTVSLVGKGLTFDSGGISLKPGHHMEEMKFDMSGAAAVLGLFKSVAALNLPINLLGVIASAENMPSGSAYKPGDIIATRKGINVEIQNTDAEGRIILADALAYAAEQNPACIIDFATLTGACVVALGSQASGLLGNDDDLLADLEESGYYSGDRAWRLPLFEEYQEQIKSDVADIKNVGGKEAGTITAACFLSRFVGDTPWAHFDIAGTAWTTKGSDLAAIGATGAGVRLTLDYLSRLA